MRQHLTGLHAKCAGKTTACGLIVFAFEVSFHFFVISFNQEHSFTCGNAILNLAKSYSALGHHVRFDNTTKWNNWTGRSVVRKKEMSNERKKPRLIHVFCGGREDGKTKKKRNINENKRLSEYRENKALHRLAWREVGMDVLVSIYSSIRTTIRTDGSNISSFYQ